jgi:hypothetical protein
MPSLKKINLNNKFSHTQLIVFAAVFALIGGILLYKSLALNPNLPGDVNNDNKVDITDLSLLLSNYNTNYPAADFNSDNTISIIDMSVLLSNYGRTYSGTPAPTVSLTANPTTINSGSGSTLSWSSTNATSCSGSGAWSGPKSISGSQSVSPTTNSTYNLSCTGSGGTASDSAAVTVRAPSPPPPPPSGGGGTLNLTNQKFNCDGPVNYDLVKVTISQTTSRMDGAALGNGCTGRIGRIEIDTWSADGIHVGAFAHDLVVEGGYVHSHGVCGSCGDVHVDGVQVLGGQRITFKNLDINYPTATNSGMYINCGNNCQDLPTDVICDGCTMKRSPEDNRVLRIGYSLRSGARNTTIYWCGHGTGCGAGEAVWYGMDPGYTPSSPVYTGITLVLTGLGG